MATPDEVKAGDFVKWASSNGMSSRGRVKRVVRNGQIEIAETGVTVTATEDNPAALIRVWRKAKKIKNKYNPTKKVVAQRFTAITKTSPLERFVEVIDDTGGYDAKSCKCKVSTIKSIDEDKRIVYGLVYEPNTIDSHGDIMLADDIEKMAHKFMQIEKLDKTIDINHDGVPVAAYPIESYIAKAGDANYNEGSWVLGVKINDEMVWRDIKSGKLNGFSFEAMVRKYPTVVEFDYIGSNFGETEKNQNHTHLFFAELDVDGRVVRGRTSTDHGHAHEIVAGTATEIGGDVPHAHRFFVE